MDLDATYGRCMLLLRVKCFMQLVWQKRLCTYKLRMEMKQI